MVGPLGLEVCDDGRVLVCDAHKGLLEVDQSTGAVEPLVEQVADDPQQQARNSQVRVTTPRHVVTRH